MMKLTVYWTICSTYTGYQGHLAWPETERCHR